MGIFNYIQRKKGEFQAGRERVAQIRHEEKQKALIEITKKRKKFEEREKVASTLTKEKGKIREIRKRKFKRNLAPLKNITARMKKIGSGESTSQRIFGGGGSNPFTQNTRSNPFTQNTGSNPFYPTKKKEKKKGITIRIQQ